MKPITFFTNILFALYLSHAGTVICKKYSKLDQQVKQTIQEKGNEGDESDSRIVGGVKAEKTDFPWLVSIGNDYTGHMCGGTILHEQVVLTAAHCINRTLYNETDLYVRYNMVALDQEDINEARVKLMVGHPKYTETKNEVFNDIALYFLEEPMKDIKTIPAIGDTDQDKGNQTVTVAGWGHTQFEGLSVSNELMKVDLETVDPQTCSKTFKQLQKNSTICAWHKEGGKDSCQGDSGGSLMRLDDNGQFNIVGIVSNGLKCGEKETPATYTRVKFYFNWIKSTMEKHGFKLEIE